MKKTLITTMLQTDSIKKLLTGDKMLKIGKNLISVTDENGKHIRNKIVTYTGDDSLVQKDMQDETDISNILEKYGRTGMLPIVANPGMYDDFSDIPDYQTAQNQIIKADEAFNALPSKLRTRFENNPAEMLKFLSNPDNTEEAIKLGLKNAPIIQEIVKEAITTETIATPTA